jgi:CRP-like cAMP-binding protein
MQSDNHCLLSIFEKQPARRVDSQETIFLQNAKAHHLYLVDSGRIHLKRNNVSGDVVTLRVVETGELFAEGALFAARYNCDASAIQISVVRKIDKAKLIQRIQNEPTLALGFLTHVTRQLHRARALIELRNIRSAETRIMEHLRLSLSPNSNEVIFHRPLLQIASDLGHMKSTIVV